MRRLERVKYVTKNYRTLQGLRQVPIGIFLLAVAISNSGIWPWYTVWKPVSDLCVLALMLVGHALVGVYYKKNFGQVQPVTRSERDTRIGIVFVLTLVVAFVLDVVFWPPVSVIGLTLAAGLFGGWWKDGKLKVHYVPAAGVLAVVSLLPLMSTITPEQLFGVGIPLSLGVVTIFIGVGDHLVLKRFLPPAPDEGSSAVR